jgi:cell division protein FtsL
MIEARTWSSPGSSRVGMVILLLAVAVVATSAAICQVWTRLRAIDFGYKISQASKENALLREQNKRLRLEVALLKNPARITQIATTELHLQPPQPEQIRRLRYTPGLPVAHGPPVARVMP